MRVFITGANGFIGSHLVENILANTDWSVDCMDIADSNISRFASDDRYEFLKGDISKDDALVEDHVRSADTVLPLAGVARPAFYIQHPLRTFELDFEMNLKIVRLCSKHGRRVVFPSTSEVYGMCSDTELFEDSTPLVTGPIRETRWIYSTGKQMMDRVIFAISQEEGLKFTIFRPFNWTGPRLDTFADAERREARAITQMIYDIVYRGTVTLVGGGNQRRSFTWIGDGIEALRMIIQDGGVSTDREIMNIGAPSNDHSVKELAETVISCMSETDAFREAANAAKIIVETPERYYGPSYADTRCRVPSIEKIGRLLDWRPTVSMHDIVRRTVEYYAKMTDAR